MPYCRVVISLGPFPKNGGLELSLFDYLGYPFILGFPDFRVIFVSFD